MLSVKGRLGENVSPLWIEAGHLVTKDMEKAEAFSAAFFLIFTARVLPSGIPGP